MSGGDKTFVSRRTLLQASAGLAGGLMLPSRSPCRPSRSARATSRRSAPGRKARKADTINVAAAVPRTGTYAVQGEDELKGWQLAVEHINSGDPLLKKIAPKVTNGLLGKKVNLLSANSAAKPNQAVQEIQTFINQNKIILMTGSHVERRCGRAQQVRAARKGALRHGHLGQQRHDRQGLRALRLPPEFLRRDGGERDRSGAGQGLRQGQEGGVHDAGLHLRSHRHQIGATTISTKNGGWTR